MPRVVIPKEVALREVEDYFGYDSEIVASLQAHNMKIVNDVVVRQAELPEDLLLKVKKKLILNIE